MQEIVDRLSALLRPHVPKGCESIIVGAFTHGCLSNSCLGCRTARGEFRNRVRLPDEVRSNASQECRKLQRGLRDMGGLSAQIVAEIRRDGRTSVWVRGDEGQTRRGNNSNKTI